MEPRISLETLELEPGERLKLLAPFLVITDRGRAFSASWSRWRPLKLTKWGVVRAVYTDQVVEGGWARLWLRRFWAQVLRTGWSDETPPWGGRSPTSKSTLLSLLHLPQTHILCVSAHSSALGGLASAQRALPPP